MTHFWAIDQKRDKKIHVQWQPAHQNLSNYASKYHHGLHHQKVRPIHVCENDSPKLFSRIPA